MPSPVPKQAYLSRVESVNAIPSPTAKTLAVPQKHRWLTTVLLGLTDTLLLLLATLTTVLVSPGANSQESSVLLLITPILASLLCVKVQYFDLAQGRHSLGKACLIGLNLWLLTVTSITLLSGCSLQTAFSAFLIFAGIAIGSGVLHHRFHWQGHHSSHTDPFYKIEFAIKRSVDVAVSLTGLVAVSPGLMLVSLALCLESPGSPLFRQIRIGKGEKQFPMFKFRSMRLDTNYEPAREKGVLFKQEDDPRITQVGHLIRKFSIDEVPQLFNVLRGEMSLIGPRPVLENEYEAMNWYHKRKFEVLPGLTGLWQITGRVENKRDFLSVANYDVTYIENWCLVEDLKILIKTIPVVLFQRGAC